MITLLLIKSFFMLSITTIIVAIDHQYNNNHHHYHHQLENDNNYNDKYNFNNTFLQNNWLSEINQSITRNIMYCSYQKVKYFDIYNHHNTNIIKKTTTTSSLSDSQFYLTYHIPSIYNKEVIRFQHLSSTITRANNYLYNASIKRGYHIDKWGKEGWRWEIPLEHEGQNRKNCVNQTILASKGIVTKFYDSYKSIHRISYLLYTKYGYIHPSGTVGISCGYYKGK